MCGRMSERQGMHAALLPALWLRHASGPAITSVCDHTDKEMEEKPMRLSERAQEILETVWIRTVEEKRAAPDLGLSAREGAVDELSGSGCIHISDGRVLLKEKGRREGARVVRRHRLAERLLVDVLAIRNDVHEVGCKFEHLLLEEVEKSVCTLLGHPKVCPHGKEISPGECCRARVSAGATR